MSNKILLIVPPFASINMPSLGVHILQAVCRNQGIEVDILYANIIFARIIGLNQYNHFSYSNSDELEAELVFKEYLFNNSYKSKNDIKKRHIDLWLQLISSYSQDGMYKVVGCTTSFEQTLSSILILREIKILTPKTLTILGGANCEGIMGESLLDMIDKHVDKCVDTIYSGESETTFSDSMIKFLKSGVNPTRYIESNTITNINNLPTANYNDYYDQLKRFLPNFSTAEVWLPYESSRGCWWARKHHCTFCGTNGNLIEFREKKPEIVLAELDELMDKHPSNKIMMTDNIMPFSYYKTLLPRLSVSNKFQIFYEQKANINIAKIKQLSEAGITFIQPGIEALSSPLLALMKKGVSAKQNIFLMRLSDTYGIKLVWNLLYDFPCDKIKWYINTAKLIPSLHHLQPPTGMFPINIDRFSPYFNNPKMYGISSITPKDGYFKVFPNNSNIVDIAYHFNAEFVNESRMFPDKITKLKQLIDSWKMEYKENHPKLFLTHEKNRYFINDTRKIALHRGKREVDIKQAQICISEALSSDLTLLNWALNNNYGVMHEDIYIPLVIPAMSTIKLINL